MLDERRTKNNDPNYLGKKYGRHTVIGFREIPNGKFHAVGWDCKCDCGNVVYGRKPFMVRSGAVRSCGCLKKRTGYTQSWGKTPNTRAIKHKIIRNMGENAPKM